MKKLTKFTLMIAMALSAIFAGVFLAACGGEETITEDDPNTFYITVVYPDGSAVNGTTDGTAGDGSKVYIQICDAETENACALPKQLGANGKLSVPMSSLGAVLQGLTRYKVNVMALPEGYTAEPVYVNGPQSVTITLQSE